MQRTHGLTLVEMLIATTVFFLISAAATAGITLTLRMQNLNEASSSAQTKLRRVGEVFTQELRSAVLGGISNTPYTSDGDSVSFALLDGGAGFQVLPHASGNNNSFKNASSVQILAPVATAAELGLAGGQAMMVNASGDAIIFSVNSVTAAGGGAFEFNVTHPGCGNTIDYTANTLMFKVATLGYDYDPVSGDMNVTEGSAAEQPFSFGLDDVVFSYVYALADGTTSAQPTPLTDAAGLPVRSGTISGQAATLVRVRFEVATSEATTGNRMVQRSYSTHVELSSNPALFVRKLDSC